MDEPGTAEPTTDESSDDLLARYAATRDRALRNEIVERHLGLAVHISRRFSRSASDSDDLRQAAMIGLVKAVERFDPAYGTAFTTFAGSTIEGELKRYLRDHTWTVRVPRAAKELHLLTRRAADELQHVLGRSPSVDEVARHLAIPPEDVLRGLAAGDARQAVSIEAPSTVRAAHVAHDGDLDRVTESAAVEQLLAALPDREREIVRLRFFEELSQVQIAERMGMSQMHVSRLLRRAIGQLREHTDLVED